MKTGLQATRHVYFHALAIDTEGSPQGNINTLVDRKYMEFVELARLGEPECPDIARGGME
jgi:hypothetical protein